MEWIFTLKEINETAAAFWKETENRKVFAFHGQMGVGKTTFVHALCEMKGVKNIVSSPTFPIINEYKYASDGNMQLLYHVDLYRLKNEEEAIRAGVEDCLYSGFICVVEWSERAPGIFPSDAIHVYLDVVDINTRRLKIV